MTLLSTLINLLHIFNRVFCVVGSKIIKGLSYYMGLTATLPQLIQTVLSFSSSSFPDDKYIKRT